MKTDLFTSGYCYISNSYAGHTNNNYAHGVDIVDCDSVGRAIGTSKIRSKTSGIVIWADNADGYGKAVWVKYDDKTVYGYGHMSDITVRRGQEISAGDIIGVIGTTGNSTGIHLHFEKRVYNGIIRVNYNNLWATGCFMDTMMFAFIDPTAEIIAKEEQIVNRYRVQIGAFTSLNNAIKCAQKNKAIIIDSVTGEQIRWS